MRSVKYWTVLFWAGLIIAGCAGLPAQVDPPQITLAGLNLANLNLLEQHFNLQLRMQNPNDFDLPIAAMSYALEINGKPFATGLSNRAVTVPKFGSELVEVEAISNLGGLIEQFNHLPKGNVHYRLKGAAHLGSGDRKVPFEQNGEIALPEMLFR